MRWIFLFFLSMPSPSFAVGLSDGIFPTVWGPISYKLYVPQNPPKKLFVLLHGCKQNGELFSRITRFNDAAEKEDGLVLYPEQDPIRNWDHCWNWFLPVNQARGWGEAAQIWTVAEAISESWRIKPAQTFLVGISSGGAMASIVSSCYPDRFAAVAIHSGLEFKAAEDLEGAETAIRSGSANAPEHAGLQASTCSAIPRAELPLILFHGTEDSRVFPVNAEQLLEQFAWTNGLWRGNFSGLIPVKPFRTDSKEVPGGYKYEISDYGDAPNPLLRKVIVHGMAHAWSGGPAGFANSDPKGPDATKMILDFFSLHNKGQ